MHKTSLLTLLVLMSFCRSVAQTNFSLAIDRLQRDQLITTREKKLLLEKYSSLGTKSKRSARENVPDYFCRYVLLHLVVQAKMF